MAVLVMIAPLVLGALAWAYGNRRWGHSAPLPTERRQ